jgi:outer membrane lipoprotein SlyB
MFMIRFDHPIRPTRGNRRSGVTGAAALVLVAGLAACGPTYSPDTYTSTAVQQAAKVEQGVLVGVREVAVSASGTVGTVTGAAAGGIVGSQVGAGALSALGALGGTVLGGLAGQAAEKVTGEPRAYEYSVRKAGGDLVSVTQKDEQPLKLGLKVLVIAGSQARIVPDYTVHEVASAPPDKTRSGTAAPGKPPPVTATPLAPPAGVGPSVAQADAPETGASAGATTEKPEASAAGQTSSANPTTATPTTAAGPASATSPGSAPRPTAETGPSNVTIPAPRSTPAPTTPVPTTPAPTTDGTPPAGPTATTGQPSSTGATPAADAPKPAVADPRET